MSIDRLRAFYCEFRADEALTRLFQEPDAGAFAGAVVALGREKGFEFGERDVQAALEDPGFFLREALSDEELSDMELAVMAGGATSVESSSGGILAGRIYEQIWQMEPISTVQKADRESRTMVSSGSGNTSSGGGTSSKP